MTPQPLICSYDEKTFTLTIQGQPHTYSNNKEGKRQAILDGLNAIATSRIEQDDYLPSNEALQLVAAVMYPEGIKTEPAYQAVCQVTERACAHIGYGAEVELGPPVVAFAARGSYRKRYPQVASSLVESELALARSGTTYPQREIACTILWNKAGFEVHGRHWSQIPPTQQEQIQAQVDAIVEQAGWQKVERHEASLYVQPLPINEAVAADHLATLLHKANGEPISHTSLVYQLQKGAYGRSFFSQDLSPTLQGLLTKTLLAHGYHPKPDEGEYWPQPLSLDLPDVDAVVGQLTALPPVMTELGRGLLLSDLVRTVVGDSPSASDWQLKQLIQTGPIGQALLRLGYQTELTWCRPQQFQPKRSDGLATPLLLKTVRVENDLTKKASLAKGFAVFTPAMAIDDEANTLIYLEMVGMKGSVKANWAALMGGNRVHWFGRQQVQLEGMKQHVKVQATLPCGWVSQVLLHKQASLKEMNPEHPFYLLDDGDQPIPALFYPMLNKCLALPLLSAWVRFLWDNGRERQLIALLAKGEGQGYAAWRVLPTPEAWQEVVQEGLQRQLLSF